MKYIKSFLITMGISIAFLLLSSSLCYINIIGNTFHGILSLIGMLLATFIGGVLVGRKSENKGYLEGIKIGGIWIIFLALLSYLGFGHSFSILKILYYLLLFLLAIIGSIVGINAKKEKEKR